MINAGAMMHKSLQDVREGGVSALTRLMSIASATAAVIVALYAILMVTLGTISMATGPVNWSFGVETSGGHFTTSPPVEKRLDMTCPELSKKTGADFSKCAWLPQTSGADEIATANKAKKTFGTWFNAAIRPVFWSLPVFLLAWGLIEASRCLSSLAQGRYFNAATTRHMRNFAITGLLYVLLTPCMPALATAFSTAVTWLNVLIVRAWQPSHAFAFSMPYYFEANAAVVGIKTFSGFLIWLYAFTLTVIATVMAKASKIVDDHAEII
ncbi:hypothetical protein MMA231_03547 (plasmid) [Asticcacaulis sp. MM231]|uniref:hypothetical protein n=1 Tax=Asticcacaulis sp. MM231 TaxID=3157666 RepID=UPI0032D59606